MGYIGVGEANETHRHGAIERQRPLGGPLAAPPHPALRWEAAKTFNVPSGKTFQTCPGQDPFASFVLLESLRGEAGVDPTPLTPLVVGKVLVARDTGLLKMGCNPPSGFLKQPQGNTHPQTRVVGTQLKRLS